MLVKRLDNGFDVVGAAVMTDRNIALGQLKHRVGGLGTAVEHPAHRAWIDEVDAGHMAVIRRMRVSGNHHLAVGFLGQFLEALVRGVGAEKLFVIGRAAVEEADKGLAEVIIGKHRNGPTGIVRLAFRGMYSRFENAVLDPNRSWDSHE